MVAISWWGGSLAHALHASTWSGKTALWRLSWSFHILCFNSSTFVQDHVDQPTLVLVMKKGSEAEVQFNCVFLFHFSHLFRWVSRSDWLCRCQWRQSGTYVWNGEPSMVQGLLAAWLFSGEYEECTPSIVNQNYDFISNDRCNRVGGEEVSGPLLENTGGPPGRRIQLRVCLWCFREIWEFEFVGNRCRS